jgi:uncharacterized protein (DUF58 family)
VVSQKDRVGALVFSDAHIEEIRPQRSRATVMRILHAVLEQNHALSITRGQRANARMFNEVLRRCERLAKHDALVCIISDGSGADDETQRILTRIAQHNDVLFVFIHDPLEGELPDAGPLIFGDGLAQMEVNTSSKVLRDRYRDTYAEHRAQGRKFLLNRETPVIPLSTTEGVADQLGRQLGRR